MSKHKIHEIIGKHRLSRNRIYAVVYAVTGLLVILIPSYILPVCEKPAMHCRAVTLPALVVIGAVTIIIAGVQFLTE